MKTPKVNIADPKLLDSLTVSEWKELQFTGVCIKGDRIIRTLAFMKRSEEGARKEVSRVARQLFV